VAVFSQRERTFLQAIVDASTDQSSTKVEQEFPSAGYRRKLMWGIREKATRSMEDWRLYLAAVQRDSRLLPRGPASETEPSPVFADPLVTILRDLRRRWVRRKPRHARGR
jgi:hypothetical protein